MAMHYKELTMFIKNLKDYKLTKQQRKTLKGQVLAGDLAGAKKGLERLTVKAVRYGHSENPYRGIKSGKIQSP